jgi:WD40 repeat protein
VSESMALPAEIEITGSLGEGREAPVWRASIRWPARWLRGVDQVNRIWDIWSDGGAEVWVDLRPGSADLGPAHPDPPIADLAVRVVERPLHEMNDVPCLLEIIGRLAAQPRARSLLALPLACGWADRTDSAGVHCRRWWTATPLGDGLTLADEVRGGGVSAATIAGWGLNLLDAVELLVLQGVAHLDIKPDNVISAAGRALLADFGGTLLDFKSDADPPKPLSLRALLRPEYENYQSDGALLCGSDKFAAPWQRVGWLREEDWPGEEDWGEEGSPSEEAADPVRAWQESNLAQRADIWGVLKTLMELLGPESGPCKSGRGEGDRVARNVLRAEIEQYLSGEPVKIPLIGDLAGLRQVLMRATPTLKDAGQLGLSGRGLPGEIADRDSQGLDLYVARGDHLHRLVAHLIGVERSFVGMVVTGHPGAGKSALLGRLTLTPSIEPALVGVDVDAVLIAGQQSIASLTGMLIASLDLPGRTTPETLADALIAVHERRGRPVRIVIDGLDEAAAEVPLDTSALSGQWQQPPGVAMGLWLSQLARQCGSQRLRLVIGVREGTPPDNFGSGWDRIQLTDGLSDVDELTDYLERLLSYSDDWRHVDQLPGRDAPPRQLAAAIARHARGNFLIGQRTVLGVRGDAQRGRAVTVADLPETLNQIFEDELRQRFPVDDLDDVKDLLRVPAVTGTVPYGEIWLRLATALSPRRRDWSGTRLDEVLRGHRAGLASYIQRIPSPSPATHDDAREVALFHESFAEWLRLDDAESLTQGAAHERVAAILLDLTPTVPGPNHSWIARALPRHAARAAEAGRPEQLGLLMNRPDLLIDADPYALLAAASGAGRFALQKEHAIAYDVTTVYRAGTLPLILTATAGPARNRPAQRLSVLQYLAARYDRTLARRALDRATIRPPIRLRWCDPTNGIPGNALPGGEHILLQHLPAPQRLEILVAEVDTRNEIRVLDLTPGAVAEGRPLAGSTSVPTALVHVPPTDPGAGERLIVTAMDGSIRSWPVASTAPPAMPQVLLDRYEYPAQAACHLPPMEGARYGGWLVTGHTDGAVRLRSLSGIAAPAVVELGPAPGAVRALLHLPMAGNPEGVLLSGHDDGALRVWDLRTATAWTQIRDGLLGRHPEGAVTALCPVTLPEGEWPLVVSGGTDGTVRAWDVQAGAPWTGSTQGILGEHDSRITAVLEVREPDARSGLVVSTGQDGTVRVWDLVGGQGWRGAGEGAVIARLSSGVASASHIPGISPGDPGVVITVGMNQQARTLDLSGALPEPQFRSDRRAQHDGRVTAVCAVPDQFTTDGGLLVSAGIDRRLRLRKTADGDLRATVDPASPQSEAWATAIAYSPAAGGVLVTGGSDWVIRAWRTSADTGVDEVWSDVTLGRHTGWVTAVCPVLCPALDPHQAWFASGSRSGEVAVLSVAALASDSPIAVKTDLGRLSAGVTAVCHCPGSTADDLGRLMSTDEDGRLQVWRLEQEQEQGKLSGKLEQERALHAGPVTAMVPVAGHPNWVVTAGQDGVIRYAHSVPGKQFSAANDQVIGRHGARITALCQLSFGDPMSRGLVVSAGADGTIRFWDLDQTSRREPESLLMLQDPAEVTTMCALFDRGVAAIALGMADGCVSIVDIAM